MRRFHTVSAHCAPIADRHHFVAVESGVRSPSATDIVPSTTSSLLYLLPPSPPQTLPLPLPLHHVVRRDSLPIADSWRRQRAYKVVFAEKQAQRQRRHVELVVVDDQEMENEGDDGLAGR